MPLTPVEVRHQQLRRGLLGYQRAPVDHLLEEVAESFELVWRERADLADRVEALEADLARHVELEGLLRSTLISAERAAQEQRDRARREADTILNEAQAEARTITREARAQKERLDGDSRRIVSLLRSTLAMVEEEAKAAEASEQQPQAKPAAPAHGQPRTTTPGVPPEFRRLAG
jgi:cell division initiation protein